MQDEEITTVIFRRWRHGSQGVIALFPTEPTNHSGAFCLSFEHIGQHGDADPAYVVRMTIPASLADEEVQELHDELAGEPYNYNLDVRQKITRQMDEARREAARRLYATYK